ncbi:MAG: 50S ribosomal protein L6 [Candidatus Woesearchaeota archaeon]
MTDETVEIPEGVEISIEGPAVSTKGSKGELKRVFRHPKIRIERKDNKISLSASNATKREKKVMGTFRAHINNMIKGVSEGHSYKLKICSGHFPMNVSMEKGQFTVKNFLGEKLPRTMSVGDDVEVKIDGSEVVVESINKEAAGQTAANIEKLTSIKGRDKRIFQDGIYITEKDGKPVAK